MSKQGPKRDKNKNLKPFKKGQSGNPAGRPKGILSTIQAEGYKSRNILDCYAKIMALNDSEIDDVLRDAGSTQLEKILAKGMQKARGTGDFWRLEQVVTRLLGSPTQKIEEDSTVNIRWSKPGTK